MQDRYETGGNNNLFEWLQDYQVLKKQIDYVEFKIEQSESELARWLNGDLRDVRLTKGSISSDLEKYIERDKKELDYLIEKKAKLVEFINKFDDLDSKLLKLRYIDGLSLYEISEQLAYSYNYIRRCHSSLVISIKLFDKHLLDYFE